jgi:spore maturation protein CgeB
LKSRTYGADFDHESAVNGADVVIVHEWTDPAVVTRLADIRRRGGRFTLLFHDTHHRAVSDSDALAATELVDYDGVLVFGEALRESYLAAGWGRSVATWHEAADTRLFHPQTFLGSGRDLIWVGNWGDDERTRELAEFLIEPARRLALTGTVHGVRYPVQALAQLKAAGLSYEGWVANADVPTAFARHRMTVHVPRRPYVKALPGIPTIRVFEALACGIPLISAPWDDCEGLFRPGTDFLMARTSDEMVCHMRAIMSDPPLAREIALSGLNAVSTRHTCAHRVDELFSILNSFGLGAAAA